MLTTILIVFLCCFALERAIPGWRLASVATWPARVIGLNVVQLLVVLIGGATWEQWLQIEPLFKLAPNAHEAWRGFAAYFIATFVFYWWHRWRHESDALWRFFHQIHHSPQRLEVTTSFYKHPGEMFVNSVLGAILVYPILGLSVEAAAYYTLCTALGEFFYHTNVRTPRWVGYIFQRPEMHRIHHEFGKHKNNYGDFVIWDMLFGTYENPATFTSTCGFEPKFEEQLSDMLQYRDVHKITIK
jgi:sterol desaturase/sphingolipid hydroxylase (fatty acid hydroxylase superfamily)